MRMTKDNVLLVTLKNNQRALSLQLLPKSVVVVRREFVSAFLGLANPCDGPPDRLAGRDTKFLQSSWITTRETPFMHKMVLACRSSRPSSVAYDQSPRCSTPLIDRRSTQWLTSTGSKRLLWHWSCAQTWNLEIDLTGGKLLRRDWFPVDALTCPVSLRQSFMACIYISSYSALRCYCNTSLFHIRSIRLYLMVLVHANVPGIRLD